MRLWVPVLWCVVLVVGLVGVPAAAAQPEAEETRLEAQLEADGDARWTIVATIPLETEEDVADFREFADAFEAGERDFQLGVDAFERAAQEASAASGREMTIRSTEREAVVVNETEDGEVVERRGELRISFTWTSFARIDENGTMYVDDAFNTTSGEPWLPGLSEGQVLIIRSPPGYGGPSTSPIGADEGDLRWEGPQEFGPGYFEIVYPKTGIVSRQLTLTNVLLGSAILLSTGALGLGGYLLWRRRDGETGAGSGTGAAGESVTADAGGEAAGGGAVAAGGSEEAGATAAGAAESTGTSGADAGTAGAGAAGAGGQAAGVDGDTAGAAGAAGAAAGADEDDPELLSDEERVEYLLEQNGGRMKQATIVKETGWSNAKVSQLLSSMEEAGRVDKLRIGRENLISLPGENVGDIADVSDED